MGFYVYLPKNLRSKLVQKNALARQRPLPDVIVAPALAPCPSASALSCRRRRAGSCPLSAFACRRRRAISRPLSARACRCCRAGSRPLPVSIRPRLPSSSSPPPPPPSSSSCRHPHHPVNLRRPAPPQSLSPPSRLCLLPPPPIMCFLGKAPFHVQRNWIPISLKQKSVIYYLRHNF